MIAMPVKKASTINMRVLTADSVPELAQDWRCSRLEIEGPLTDRVLVLPASSDTGASMSSRSLPASLLVLGGTSDIAEETVRHLSTRGLRKVVLAGRSLDRLGVTQARLRHTGLETVALAEFDANETQSHEADLNALADEHGPFDAVLVAFGALGNPFTIDEDAHDAAQLVNTNFSGAVSASMVASRLLINGGGGTLIIISSIAAVRPRVGNLIYGSAKAGLDAFAGAMSDALKKTNVDVLVVRPGFVHTAMTEGLEAAPFATTPDKVAVDIVSGLESGAGVVWSPAILKVVAPVLKNMPGKLWRRMSER